MSAPGLNRLNQLQIEVARLKSRSKHASPVQVKQEKQPQKPAANGQQQPILHFKQQKAQAKRSLIFELLQREREKQGRVKIRPKIEFKSYLAQYRPEKVSNEQRKRIFMTLKELRRLQGRR